MDIGAFLRRQRESQGLTQREFGQLAGLPVGTVSSYETGRRVPPVATIESLLGAIGQQLALTTEPLWADVDREIAAIQGLTAEERLARVPVLFDWWHDRLADLDVVLDGPVAALMLGAPVPVRSLDLAVPAAALNRFAELLSGVMNLRRWSDNWQDWGYSAIDPREPGPLRWKCAYGEIRARLMELRPRSVDVLADGQIWPVRPLSDVESDDPWVTRVLTRMRGGLRSGP
jgi:transcriptional regulator with XRE-family HTH domain